MPSTAMDPGDQAHFRFTQLWTAAQPAVAGFVRSLVRDRVAADDVLQETALALFTGFAGYDAQRPFLAWALGVARHKVQDRWRQQARNQVLVQDTAQLDALVAASVELADDLDRHRVALEDCVRGVDGRNWDLLRLHYHQDQPPQAIAERLGLPASHVRVLLTRLRQSLRACVERRLAGGATTGTAT